MQRWWSVRALLACLAIVTVGGSDLWCCVPFIMYVIVTVGGSDLWCCVPFIMYVEHCPSFCFIFWQTLHISTLGRSSVHFYVVRLLKS